MDKKQDVMISIRPFYTGEILAGVKEIEVRKGRPKQDPPFKCFIYCTKSANRKTAFEVWVEEHLIIELGKVVGEFICDRIDIYTTVADAKHECTISDSAMHQGSCLTEKELHDYEFSAPHKDFTPYSFGLFGWHITNLKMYKKPRPLSDFCTGSSVFTFDEDGRTVYTPMKRAPQSWCYVAERKVI